jgi:ABC-2 type transport system permease protein
MRTLRFELRKLRAQHRARMVLLGALVMPFVLAVVIHGQSRPPKDTLFGRFAIDNGFALALLVLGFAGQWVLPLLTAIVAGDIFASEDQHGTWKTVLTRSTGRWRIFAAKTLVALGFALVALTVLAAATIGASLLVVGHGSLTGLTGQVIEPAAALRLVAAAWATAAAPTLAVTALAILLAIWSRNPAVGIAAPVVIAMVMQLVGALGGLETVRPVLFTTGFEAWHGLFAAPHFFGPIQVAAITGTTWTVLCLGLSFLLFRRRDITGG